MSKFKILICILLLVSGSLIGATKKPKKLKPIWTTSYKTAIKYSKKYDRPILINFTGSDWCGWCIKLKDEVFDKKEFKDYVSTNLILLEADFPRRKRIDKKTLATNKQLAEKYGVKGYPTILLIDAKGEVLGKTGYKKGGPVNYVEHLKKIVDAGSKD
jgi:protein disulfide-isomerase